MRKLIRKCQNGVDTSSLPSTLNIGASSLNVGNGLSKEAMDGLAKAMLNNGKSGFFSMLGGGLKNIFGGSAGGGTPYGMIGSAVDTLSSLIPTHKSSETQAADSVFDNVSNGVMMINPLAGTIMKAGGLVSDGLNALGVRTDQVTGIDKALGSKWLSLTGTGLLNNSITTKLASLQSGQDVNDTMARLDGGYGDFMNSWDDASKYSGKTIGLLNSASKYNNKIYAANHMMDVLRNITGKKYTDDLLTAQMGDRWNERTMMDMNGGPGNISFGRLGLKVEILPKVHALLNKPKVLDTLKEWEEEVPEFKEGGKMNVIPEGSLHARLHHMENADGLTKKGIPVVSIAEGGELEQQAEIELNEIIFNLEVTTELEKLMKDGSDNAAIEAGKLLVKEIFENTDDRTGLIKQLEPEKKEPSTEDIVKYHKVFQGGGIIKPPFEEWYKTVPQDRNNIENYNLKRAYELAPWEELERWRTATPEQLNDDKYHLKTFYWNDKGEGEFVKKNGHPTLIKELEDYFTNKDFREKYDLDMSGDYFKYVKRK